MRSILALLAAALVFGLVGWALLGVSRLETHLATAAARVSTLQYGEAGTSLDEAERYTRRARAVPVLGGDARQEIAARRAAVLYWQRQYDAVLPAGAEPVAAVDEGNVELQMVVANAAYRAQQQARITERQALVKSLEETAAGYLTVLKNNTWHPDAAFNYEYLVRLRDEAAKGRQPPPPQENEEDADLGESGAPTPATSQEGFQIYIPLEQGEKNPTGGEAGQAAPRERKG